jgi:hypothetical protein
MLVQFITHNYNDFKLLVQRFKPELPDVVYVDVPFDGTSRPPGVDTFTVWAFDYARGLEFFLLIENSPSTGTPDDPMPSTFLTDFPQATAVSGPLLVNVSG